MKTIVFCALLVLVLSGPSAPVWPNRWQAKFTEYYMDNTTYFINGTTTGLYSYDYLNRLTRLDRLNGAQDPLCNTIFPGNTACSQIITGGNRYMYFAEKNSCCICCGAAEGCDVLKPTWAADSEYAKTVTGPTGDNLNEWVNYDDDITYYTERASDHAPYQLFRTGVHDLFLFQLNTFSKEFSNIIFELPPVCKNAKYCPATSMCGKIHGMTGEEVMI